ncbi:MAG: DEAD/DEAH box helicase [Verrucomicrobia bacterium]|nr:DEAD/DEAH box helicase [Verrucomicrobiota bacterium]MCH8527302.1 DEAD/DEAH box helicase [Kiritimatiellia bacterium]
MILVYELLEPRNNALSVQIYGMEIEEGLPMRGTRYPAQPQRLLDKGMSGLTLSKQDRKILLNMIIQGQTGSARAVFRGRDAHRLIELLIQTGRAYAWNHPESPLAFEPRPANAPLAWKTADIGFAPTVRLPGDCSLLPAKPMLLLHSPSGVCQPLGPPELDDAAWAWLTTPPMPETAVNRFFQTLTDRYPHAGLPPPPSLEHVVLNHFDPVPGLHIHLVPADREDRFLAEPLFYYGDKTFPPATKTERIRFLYEDQLVEAPRMLGAEQAALGTLEENGMTPCAAPSAGDLFSASKTQRGWEPVQPLTWTTFFTETTNTLQSKGWRITFEHNAQPHLPSKEDGYAEFTESKRGWMSFEQGVRIDGKPVNLLPALHAFLQSRAKHSLDDIRAELRANDVPVATPEGLVLIPGPRFLRMVEQLHELFGAGALDANNRLRLNPWRAAEVAEGTPGNWTPPEELRQALHHLRGALTLEPLAPPPAFQGELRAYQQRGLAWLNFLRQTRLGGILADDMGLGKTVQLLALLALQAEENPDHEPVLIVCPASVLPNWRRECRRFTPHLNIAVMHGADRHDDRARIESADILLTTYTLLWRDQTFYEQVPLSMLILDEAQAVKNPKSRGSRVAASLNARLKLAVTGTPCENHLGDLWALFHIVQPGFLGGEKDFRTHYRKPIEQEGRGALRSALQNRIRPLLLRRTKDLVARDLPPKTEIIVTIPLSEVQTDQYQTIRSAMSEKIQTEMAAKGLNQSRFTILDAMLKLRQTCCDPRLLQPEHPYTLPDDSAKLAHLMEMIPELIEEGRRILLFSQFTSMLDLIKPELAKQKIPHVEIRGDTRDRDTPVQRFQNGEVPLFLISLKAGGSGLNLTAADTVIHYDPWWNPAVEAQATDRAHRIGQDKPVFVYKLITEGTLENTILDMQTEKRKLAGLIESDDTSAFNLTQTDLQRLLAPLDLDA